MRRLFQVLMVAALVTAVSTFVPRVTADAAPLCFGQPATITGSGGLVGTGGPDVIVGTDASQSIQGGGGDDIICGKGGHDNISGGSGNDVIDGGAGNDNIDGDGGNDEIHGGSGDDKMLGGGGRDQIIGDGGRDVASGGDGRDGCDAEKESSCEEEALLVTECNDGIDNDGDGFIDTGIEGGDPGCDSPSDQSELNPNVECDDGFDNDGDNRFDFGGPQAEGEGGPPTRGDPDCDSPLDDSESAPVTECNDGVDNNDTDQLVDEGDPGCEGPADTSEVSECEDGLDNDNDGGIDFGFTAQGGAGTDGGQQPSDFGCDSFGDNTELAEG